MGLVRCRGRDPFHSSDKSDLLHKSGSRDGWFMYGAILHGNPDIERILALTRSNSVQAVIFDTSKSAVDPNNVRLMVQA